MAADICYEAGADGLAWEYLTTPVALNPNESGGWRAIAHMMSEREQIELASMAYTEAFRAEDSPPPESPRWQQYIYRVPGLPSGSWPVSAQCQDSKSAHDNANRYVTR